MSQGIILNSGSSRVKFSIPKKPSYPIISKGSTSHLFRIYSSITDWQADTSVERIMKKSPNIGICAVSEEVSLSAKTVIKIETVITLIPKPTMRVMWFFRKMRDNIATMTMLNEQMVCCALTVVRMSPMFRSEVPSVSQVAGIQSSKMLKCLRVVWLCFHLRRSI